MMQSFDSVVFPLETELSLSTSAASNTVSNTFDFNSLNNSVLGGDLEFALPITEYDMASLFAPNTIATGGVVVGGESNNTNTNKHSTTAANSESTMIPSQQPFALPELVDIARQAELIDFSSNSNMATSFNTSSPSKRSRFEVATTHNDEQQQQFPIVSQVPFSPQEETFDFLLDMEMEESDLFADGTDYLSTTNSSVASSPAPSVVPSLVGDFLHTTTSKGGRSKKVVSSESSPDGIKKPKRKRKTVGEKSLERKQRLEGLTARGVELRQTLRDTYRQLERLKPFMLMLVNNNRH